MTATTKTVSSLLLAALLSAALFLSPVGISNAQDEAPDTEGAEQSDRPNRGDLTDEEREALQADREAARAQFADDVAAELGVTTDELTDAFKTVAIQRVEAKLEAGDITQEQADTIIERIESSDGFPGLQGQRGHRGHGGRGGSGADGAGFGGDAASDAEEI